MSYTGGLYRPCIRGLLKRLLKKKKDLTAGVEWKVKKNYFESLLLDLNFSDMSLSENFFPALCGPVYIKNRGDNLISPINKSKTKHCIQHF